MGLTIKYVMDKDLRLKKKVPYYCQVKKQTASPFFTKANSVPIFYNSIPEPYKLIYKYLLYSQKFT